MLVPLVALLALPQGAVHTVELYKGAAIPGLSPRYWAVEDTTLDSTQNDLDQGWSPELIGGPFKTVLVQFNDLNRVLGPNKHVVKASLVLTLAGGGKFAMESIGKLLQPWHEGPNKTIMEANPDSTEASTEAARFSATWRHRRAGTDGILWQKSGAQGEEDSTVIAEAKGAQDSPETFRVDGLEAAVQQQYDHPFDNHGFVLKLDKPIEFLSSNAGSGRPKLIIQYEDAPASHGPDLSITYIERTPEYERIQASGADTVDMQDGQNIGFPDHVLNALSKHWPTDGEEVTYTAHIKNVGDAAASGFKAQWTVKEKPGSTLDVSQALAPGAETTVTLKQSFRNNPRDHRIESVALTVLPSGPDASSANNSLQVEGDGLNVGVYVEKSAHEAMGQKLNAFGSHSFEDWIQYQVAILNNVYFPFSRFSFATDGVLERVRIQRVVVVPDGTLKPPLNLPDKTSMAYDAEIGFTAKDLPADPVPADVRTLKNICLGLGLPDLAVANVPAGPTSARATADEYPGLMGGGDTRDDARLPRTFQVPYQPYFDLIADQAKLEPTDLLALTDVAQLNSNLGKRAGLSGDVLYDTPVGVIMGIKDYGDRKLTNVNLTFYQMVNGVISDKTPAFTLNSGKDGSIRLPSRETRATAIVSDVNGHTLRPNPFGRIDRMGRNSAFLVKAEANGVTEWAPLKLWQIVDTYHRGQKGIALMSLHFNLPSDTLDPSTDLAKGKTVTASDQSAVAGLLDGTNTDVTLPAAPEGWIEVDLGKDLTVGEIRLLAHSSDFWNSFDIRTYATGQKPTEAMLWSREYDWPWSFHNRSDQLGNGLVSVAYRGPANRFRFIRIINKSSVPGAKLAGIQVIPVKQPG